MAESLFVTAPDGLKLHARVHGVATARLPVLCLPGLSRNTRDFDDLAADLARERQVVALDYRGRGLSGWDPVWENYALPVESQDILAVTTALGLSRCILLGTSRGGIHTMILTAARPGLIVGAILNDIGPVIDGRGLARIKSYLGKLPNPPTFDAAADLLKAVAGKQFPSATGSDWHKQARAIWCEKENRLVLDFDPNLAKTLDAIDFDQPLPTLWPQFDGLAHVPAMVIRGEHSDILAPETVQAMVTRRPDLEVLVVPGQGHAPFLTDQPTIGRIAAFCRRCDAAQGH